MGRGTVRRIIRKDMKLFPYKIQKAQKLTDKQMQKRLQKSKGLQERLSNGTLHNTVFTDEKIFTVEQAVNKQNDRILASSLPDTSNRTAERSAHPTSVMVWAGITSEHKTPLVFVDPGVKVDQKYYIEKILDVEVKPWALQTFKNQKWLAQRDGALAHTARKTQQWFRDNSIDFITKDE